MNANAHDAVDILVGLAGLLGLWLGLKRTIRKDREDHDQEQATIPAKFGTAMAEAAFDSLKAQVADFTTQQRLLLDERHALTDYVEKLTRQVTELNFRINVTNQYVQHLLIVLDRNDITHPPVPPGLTIARETE